MSNYASFTNFFNGLLEKFQEPEADIMIKEVAKIQEKYFLEQFNSQSFNGEAWEPLAESTLKDKARKGFGGKPSLVRTGDLKTALEEGLKKSIDTASMKNGIEITVDCDYAGYHNYGDGKIPKRRFIGPSYELNNILIDSVEEELQKILNKL